MREILFFSLFAILTSCNFKSEINKSEFSVDRVNTTFENFKFKSDSSTGSVDYALAKCSLGDSLQYYFYVQNREDYQDCSFRVKDDCFEYLNNFNSPNFDFLYTPLLIFFGDSLVLIDTFMVPIRQDSFTLCKYEFVNPPVDGGGACLFCENYGLVGYMSYAWGNRYFLTKWNNIDIEEEVRTILENDDENRYFLNKNKTLYKQ